MPLNILNAGLRNLKKGRMLPRKPINKGVRAASFLNLGSGDFSDLSNELRRLARIAKLNIHQPVQFFGAAIGLTPQEALYPLKPKKPV